MENSDSRPIIREVPIAWTALFDAFARRALDILASVLGLLILAPVFAVIAVAIKRDTPGPVFFRGPRMGRGGRTFGILKFRTMFERPECYAGPSVTAAGDVRITPLGRWLRDTKVNELPQLWNVLVGEMSLVGPRPEDPKIAAGWPAKTQRELLAVRPGITSPATILFRDEESMLRADSLMDDYLRAILPDKLRMDSLYVRSRSFLTDLDVLFMTLIALLPRLRETRIPEPALYWGPLSRFVSNYLNWFLLDTLAAFAAVSLAGLVWRVDSPLNMGLNLAFALAVFMALSFSLANLLLGLSHIQWRRAPASEIFPLAFSTGLATLTMLVVEYVLFGKLTHIPHLPVSLLLASGALSFLGFCGMRYRTRLLTGLAAFWLRARGPRRTIGERVLLVGAGVNSQFAVWLLTHSQLAQAFSIVGIADDDPRKQGMYFDGFPVLGSTRQLSELIRARKVDLVLFTITNIDPAERLRIIKACQVAHTRLVILPDVLADLTACFQPGIPVEELAMA